MKIIEIAALHNGAHRNQSWDSPIPPDGWAIIPDDMGIPQTFPFVDITVVDVSVMTETQESVKVKTVSGMVAG